MTQRQLRDVLGLFATGVTVVTAGSDIPRGMTVNSFTSVSLQPPLVLICLNNESAIRRQILEEGVFAISMLSCEQESVARHFANKSRSRGEEEFRMVDWVRGPQTGAPLILGGLAWLECRLAAVYHGGDHSIFLGAVEQADGNTCRDALLFFGGDFHRLESSRTR
jgi:flavin reductase (DIM6/NTAB) family NADH-FMN oxidoreductase RutF